MSTRQGLLKRRHVTTKSSGDHIRSLLGLELDLHQHWAVGQGGTRPDLWRGKAAMTPSQSRRAGAMKPAVRLRVVVCTRIEVAVGS
jgi:hypothetical protein